MGELIVDHVYLIYFQKKFLFLFLNLVNHLIDLVDLMFHLLILMLLMLRILMEVKVNQLDVMNDSN